MRVAYLMRKCNPAEWGGTETVVQRLWEGLKARQVSLVVYCPRCKNGELPDPLPEAGCTVKRFHAFMPVWGLSPPEEEQLVSVGGNLMSFDLIGAMWREPGVSLIHAHTLGRLGGIALTVARSRDVPFVVTIHGGFLDIPQSVRATLNHPPAWRWEWGKLFGWIFQSRRLVERADAILVCNPREAALLQERYPWKRVVVQPHGVPTSVYQTDHREAARRAFPQLRGRTVLLTVGRIDRVKNQEWLIQQASQLFERHPLAMLVLAGACTDAGYGRQLERSIARMGLGDRVLLTGGFLPNDPRLIGLYQTAGAVVVPSLSETFGLVILEAWAAGSAVIASRTSGACALIQPGENGWLFDCGEPSGFHQAVDQVLSRPESARRLALNGARLVRDQYDTHVLAGRLKQLYEQLIEERHALRHTA